MIRRNVFKVAALLLTSIAAFQVSGTSPASAANAGEAGPVLAVINHTVKDYAAWLPVYEGAESLRAKSGVTGAEVFRDPSDPNKLTIIHRFKTVVAANAFLADPALKAAMAKGGVIGAPTSIVVIRP
jgi:quinol monooxygenase YgiN